MATEDNDRIIEQMMDLVKMKDEPLHPDLQGWVEESEWGPMLRHPLVYLVPLMLPGQANMIYEHKRKALDKAIADEDWHMVVFLHERPYRLKALIDYVTGRDEFDNILPAASHWSDLVADVWVDSENIEQNIEEWRALLCNGEGAIWLGTEWEREQFDALPDPIQAWRGGVVGDWSWTTRSDIAEFFSRRSKYPVRQAMIPKADCFGYFTRRGEAELLVRLTPERVPLVYPNLHEDWDRWEKPECPTCEGTGEVLGPVEQDHNGVGVRDERECPDCGGSGRA